MLKQTLQQKLLQKLSPQQIQLMKLLQVPTISLEQRIKEELESNPALEEGREDFEDNTDNNQDDINSDHDAADQPADTETSDNSRDDFDYDQYFDDDEIPAYKLTAKNTGPDEEHREIPLSGGSSFHDNLRSQLGLRLLNDRQEEIGEYIIGNIDDDGYLRREIDNMIDDLAFSQNVMTTHEEMEEVLAIIQTFDPPGVGARNLQECLILQLKRRQGKSRHIDNALDIMNRSFDEFTKKHYDRIARKHDLDEELLKTAIGEILKLNPKPGNSGSDSTAGLRMEIVPDFVVSNTDGELELSLNSRNAPDLKISRQYKEMLEDYSRGKNKETRDAAMFVKQKIDSAKWFIDAIKQRQETLLLTMKAILDYQYDYFLEGDETRLKPMILKDIADRVGLDISTISRVANSKYVQTEFGTIPLKYFFSESLSTDSGEEVSTREVKKILQDFIAAEDKNKPLTDDKLAKILKEKGYNIARRTVAKYREQLNIPVARLRKEL